MSKDIRSFFTVVSKKPKQQELSSTKKRVVVLDSSDEDVVQASPVQVKTKVIPRSKKRKIIESDSDEEKQEKNVHKKKNDKTHHKKVNVADVFGNVPIKQTKPEKRETTITDHIVKKQSPNKTENGDIKKKSPNTGKDKESPIKLETEFGIHDDPEFEQTLLDIDNEMLLDKTIEEALSKGTSTPTVKKKESNIMPKRKAEDDEDNGIDRDQERYEKKRQSAILYQKYLNRSGPLHQGEKEYPKGNPNCLQGLCFLRTGVLDSLDDNDFQSLIKEHGGRTVHSVSKKVNYVVVGTDPGPAKLEKARSLKIASLSEDELLDLILTKSGMPPKYNKNLNSSVSIEEKPVQSPKKSEPEKKISKKSQSELKSPNESESKVKSPNKLVEKNVDAPDVKGLKDNDTKSSDAIVKKESFYSKKDIIPAHNAEMQTADIKKDKPGTAPTIPNENLSWADKYKPQNIKAIIGQQGDKSNMRKLVHWLSNWYKNHSGKQKPKLIKPSPWAKSDDGAFFKCSLLSGPPGVGKTTTATLVAKELGFDIVELNASDTRNKKLLHERVTQLLSTSSLAEYVKDGSAPSRKHVLLMDEVDGMAGNEDRGGMQELIQLIKGTSVPIICMCNDRNHPKVRSLANYCFDLRFSKPRLEQIRGAMMTICFKENLKMKPEALSQIITGTGMDIRQTLNHLSMWTINNNSMSVEEAEKNAASAKKDTILGPWEVLRKVFSAEEHKNMTIGDRFRLFFFDYSIGPLFVQENYLQVEPHCPKREFLARAAATADTISRSDLVDKKMRSSNNWSLLEIQALYSSVLPGHYMKGHVKGQINFPGWLGKNSKKGKFKRLVSELQAHMRISTTGSRRSVNLDYVYHLRNNIIKPLVDEGTGGIEKALNVMRSYNLLREDLDGIVEVCHWSRQKDPWNMVDSKVKSAFTRAYNKDSAMLPYSTTSAAVKKKTSAILTEENPYDEEENDSSPEDNDDITKDAMIKAKKKPSKTKNNAEPTTSKKAGGSGKGKGSKKTK